MSARTRSVNAVSARSISDELAAPAVNPLVRWISQAWFWPQRLLLRRRVRELSVEHVAGRPFVVLPDVFNPGIFRTGRFLADYLLDVDGLVAGGHQRPVRALDVGTGCGVHAVVMAGRGMRVDAVDISAAAVRCARMNVILNNVSDAVTVHQGDLFAPVAPTRYDLITCSLPKFRGKPQGEFDGTWRSTDVIDRFAEGLPAALEPGGVALVLLTTHGDERGMLDALSSAGLSVDIAVRRHFGVEYLTIYRATHAACKRPVGPGVDHDAGR